MLNFEPETHTYSVDGRIIPSVTTIIESVLPQRECDPYYLQRGMALHHGCRLMDEGRLDWSSVDPAIEGRLRAWERFRRDYPGKMLLAEFPIAHPLYQFAGTPDRVFLTDDGPVIVDIKSTIAPQVRAQIGGYSLLLRTSNLCGKARAGAAVQLADDGTYRTLWMDRKEVDLGERLFLACLTVHGFKQKEKL